MAWRAVEVGAVGAARGAEGVSRAHGVVVALGFPALQELQRVVFAGHDLRKAVRGARIGLMWGRSVLS